MAAHEPVLPPGWGGDRMPTWQYKELSPSVDEVLKILDEAVGTPPPSAPTIQRLLKRKPTDCGVPPPFLLHHLVNLQSQPFPLHGGAVVPLMYTRVHSVARGPTESKRVITGDFTWSRPTQMHICGFTQCGSTPKRDSADHRHDGCILPPSHPRGALPPKKFLKASPRICHKFRNSCLVMPALWALLISTRHFGRPRTTKCFPGVGSICGGALQ